MTATRDLDALFFFSATRAHLYYLRRQAPSAKRGAGGRKTAEEARLLFFPRHPNTLSCGSCGDGGTGHEVQNQDFQAQPGAAFKGSRWGRGRGIQMILQITKYGTDACRGVGERGLWIAQMRNQDAGPPVLGSVTWTEDILWPSAVRAVAVAIGGGRLGWEGIPIRRPIGSVMSFSIAGCIGWDPVGRAIQGKPIPANTSQYTVATHTVPAHIDSSLAPSHRHASSPAQPSRISPARRPGSVSICLCICICICICIRPPPSTLASAVYPGSLESRFGHGAVTLFLVQPGRSGVCCLANRGSSDASFPAAQMALFFRGFGRPPSHRLGPRDTTVSQIALSHIALSHVPQTNGGGAAADGYDSSPAA
ncbi:hypothetical protein JHW43_006300 [Diplocarpon mali]|nr:hypothetical protein JHW43_006300 [Diplocarpon mali]